MGVITRLRWSDRAALLDWLAGVHSNAESHWKKLARYRPLVVFTDAETDAWVHAIIGNPYRDKRFADAPIEWLARGLEPGRG